MAGTFDDFVYGAPDPVPTLEAVRAEAVPEPEAFFKVEAPPYEEIKAAKEDAEAKMTPEEIAVVAEHKRVRRQREEEDRLLQQRRRAEDAVLEESSPETIHSWALVAMHAALQETEPRKQTELYEDATRYLGILRRRITSLAREAKIAAIAEKSTPTS